MPDVVPQQLLLLPGMVPPFPARMIKIWWFSSTLRMLDPLTSDSTKLKKQKNMKFSNVSGLYVCVCLCVCMYMGTSHVPG